LLVTSDSNSLPVLHKQNAPNTLYCTLCLCPIFGRISVLGLDAAQRLPGEDLYAFRARVQSEAIAAGLIPQAPALPTLNAIFSQNNAEVQKQEVQRRRDAIANPDLKMLAGLPLPPNSEYAKRIKDMTINPEKYVEAEA
jgi:hypothetical protein